MAPKFSEDTAHTFRLIYLFGIQDLKQAYRRTTLGPFWITIGMAIQTVTTGFVFSLIFKIELNDYLPFLALNTVIWTFIASSINESCGSIVQSESLIKQIKLPSYLHALRIIWKNLLITGHNFIILPLIFLLFWKKPIEWFALAALPGFLFLIAILACLGYIFSVVCLRFRDITPIVSSSLNVLYFVTPIMWKPELLGDDALAHLLLGVNPLYHCFQVIRAPLLGEMPTLENWIGVTLVLTVAALVALKVSKTFSKRLVFWL